MIPEAGKGRNIVKSACRMCHGGCGVLVHVEDGKVVKIKGDPASPLNKGLMCVKGLSSIEHLYNPKRLKYPLKRAGKRGEGRWERISWDVALETIASKINQIRQEYGVESVAVGTGTGRHHFQHVLRFANALGTPNWCEPGTAQCFIPRILTGVMTYGDHRPPHPSFGFRVEYAGRTVVISGDVEWCGDPDDPIDDPRCDNVQTYAQDADVLVHEVYSQYLADLIIDVALTDFDPPREDVAELTRNAVDHHTPELEVAQVAAAANVGQLVLTHLIPPTPHDLLKGKFVEGMDAIYSGPIILADDGTDIYLP